MQCTASYKDESNPYKKFSTVLVLRRTRYPCDRREKSQPPSLIGTATSISEPKGRVLGGYKSIDIDILVQRPASLVSSPPPLSIALGAKNHCPKKIKYIYKNPKADQQAGGVFTLKMTITSMWIYGILGVKL